LVNLYTKFLIYLLELVREERI
ncbi:MAG: hypothetical protein K0S44_3436, partial [Bacteroidetes bacterium]|nr:hypothetical protein [Bacteroidota bacterium]